MLLCAAIAGFALGAGPAVGAKHRKGRLIAKKARVSGHVPARSAGRPPLVGTLSVPSTSPTVPTTTDTQPPAPSCPTAIGVTEGEYYTHTSRSTACAGAIRIELRNAGEDPHNLEVRNLGTDATVATWADLAPGGVKSQPVTLAAGTYKLFCTIPTHEEKGMQAVITVG
jgi:plastocyanin